MNTPQAWSNVCPTCFESHWTKLTFNAVIICCTHGFGDSLVFWASEHVKWLYLGGKTAQQDWLKQNRMPRKLLKQGTQCISTEIRSTLLWVHRKPKPPGKTQRNGIMKIHLRKKEKKTSGRTGCRSEICLSLWPTALIKRESGKLNSKYRNNYTC